MTNFTGSPLFHAMVTKASSVHSLTAFIDHATSISVLQEYALLCHCVPISHLFLLERGPDPCAQLPVLVGQVGHPGVVRGHRDGRVEHLRDHSLMTSDWIIGDPPLPLSICNELTASRV